MVHDILDPSPYTSPRWRSFADLSLYAFEEAELLGKYEPTSVLPPARLALCYTVVLGFQVSEALE